MRKYSLICLMTLITSPAVYAQNSQFYMGIVGGFMDAGTGISDNAINSGFDIGYRHNRYLSTEVEYTQTLIDGETASSNDWEVDTLSIYAAFRSNTSVKLKAKVGISDIDTGNRSDTEVSMGIGIGFWALGGLTEIEYTEISSDDELEFLSIGVKYFF